MKPEYKGHAAMLAANIMWGLMSPISKAVMNSGMVNAISLTTFRMLGAAVLFWMASAFTKREHVPHQDMMRLFFAALLGIVLNQGLFIFGVSYTSPIDSSIVATTTPIITMIIAAFYLKEPITGKKVLGIFMGAVGAMMLIFSGNRGAGAIDNQSSALGDILCLLAQVSFSCYFVFFKDLTAKYSPVTMMKWMFTYASICVIPFSYNSILSIDFQNLPISICGDILYVVALGTFVTFLLTPIGQRTLRPTVGVMYNYVQPIIASLVAVLWGMDVFGWVKGAAVGLVFLGVYIVTRSKSRAQIEAYRKEHPLTTLTDDEQKN